MSSKTEDKSLTLRVDRISEEGEDFVIALEGAELASLLRDVSPDYRSGGQELTAELRLARCEDNVFVKGTVDVVLASTCSRCLADLSERYQVAIQWTFLPVGPYRDAAVESDEVELTAEDLDVSFYVGDEVDLREIVREALALELDPYPSCSGQCRVADRLKKDAEEAALDPRWLPLLALKRKQRS